MHIPGWFIVEGACWVKFIQRIQKMFISRPSGMVNIKSRQLTRKYYVSEDSLKEYSNQAEIEKQKDE